MRRMLSSVLVATILLIVLLGARPLSRATVFAGYAIVLAAIGLTALSALLQEARAVSPSRFDAELQREAQTPTRPADLIRAERELVLAASDGRHYRRRLQPLLEEIAAARGVEVDVDVESPSMRDLKRLLERLEAG